jgi:hypothetical protein
MSEFMNLDRQTIVAMERIHGLLAEAERVRLVREARANEPNRMDSVLSSVGGLLVSVGERLQARRVRVAPPSCDVCRTDCGVAVN